MAKRKKSEVIKPITLKCKCGTPVDTYTGVKKVVCADCTMADQIKRYGMPKGSTKDTKIKKPRGWALQKVFVDIEGNVYHKGKLQPELKGTLEPTKKLGSGKTKRTKKPALTNGQKADKVKEITSQITTLKKEIKVRKRKKMRIKRLQMRVEKLNKELRKYV